MQPLTAADPQSRSADILAQNIDQLKALFPEVVVEGKIDFEVLKQLLGGAVEEREEKYGLNWHGKRRARQLALTPSTGTLRPCPEESVEWETTQNLMIEGDNLEVLKLLQKSYAGKVKLIYIDPPYNTGKDFVYPDNFQDNIKNYLELTGQTGEGGKKFSSNTEASGRFHTDWLNMMYPRLKLARNLLREDGVLFISIDDAELSRLLCMTDELFGQENFESVMTWRRRHNQPNDKTKMIAKVSEYIVAFARHSDVLSEYKAYYGVPLTDERIAEYTNPDGDPRGPWTSNPWKAAVGRGGSSYALMTPTGTTFNETWYGNSETFDNLIAQRRVHWTDGGNGFPRIKVYLDEAMKNGQPAVNFFRHELFGTNSEASAEVAALLGAEGTFDNPKPVRLLQALVQIASRGDDVIMDFFAGSGTTGQAVMAQNVRDGGARRHVLVQLPEPLLAENGQQRAAAELCKTLGRPTNIAELTKERLRRAGKKIREENPLFAGDTGFRVFKLDSSNIRTWEADRDNLEQMLLEHAEHIKPGRSELDIIYELLLKLGLDLCVPIERRTMAGKEVYSIGGGVLLACLSPEIGRGDVEALGQAIVTWHKELNPAGDTTCVLRDSAFVDDVAKTNLAAILQQHGIENVRSL